ELVHTCQVVDLQNQRDAYSTVDGSTAPDGFGSSVTSIVRHVDATEKQDAIALAEMCVSEFATLIRNGKHFPEAEVTVEDHGRLDILDRQDGYDRRNACNIVHGVALLFLEMNAGFRQLPPGANVEHLGHVGIVSIIRIPCEPKFVGHRLGGYRENISLLETRLWGADSRTRIRERLSRNQTPRKRFISPRSLKGLLASLVCENG